MGGVVPIGYRVENRALHVVDEHAAFVRDYRQVSSGRLTTIGVDVLLTTTHRNGRESDGLISMCGRNAGTWMKSPASALAANSPFAPQRTSYTPDKTYAKFLYGVASFRGISTPSLTAQGEQRRSLHFQQ